MKSKIHKKRAASETNAKRTLRSALRTARRSSPYAFAATLGIWLPNAEAATLVNLDATGLLPADFPTGLSTWTNTGSLLGDFVSVGGVVPPVMTIDGVNCLGITNAIGTAAAGGTQYAGPSVPDTITNLLSRTIEAWILDPETQGTNEVERSIVGYGRRAAANNFVLGHGSSTEVGAVNVSLANLPDPNANIGWNDNFAANRWTYIAATFDGQTITVYKDGVLANAKIVGQGRLNTQQRSTDNTVAIPIRIGRQTANNAAAGQSGVGVGPFYVSRVRVSDTNLSAATILANFNAEKAAHNLGDTDTDGLPDWWEIRNGLNPGDATGANGATGDPDADGATNLEEYNANSNPNVADTDGDGINDGTELHRTDPQTTGAAPTDPTNTDTDRDGLSDAAETDDGSTTTDPVKADTDGDGFSDGYEASVGTNPLNAGSAPSGPIIELSASGLPLGGLLTWTNIGSMAGSNFVAVSATNLPAVEMTDGVKGVHLRTIGGGGATGQHYLGPQMPPELAGALPKTVDAWVRDLSAQDEKTTFVFGRRGGNPATGNNFSLGMGQNDGYGAVAMWGGPDIGWRDQEVRGRWTHIAGTYNGTQTRVYVDGKLVDIETIAIDTKRFAAIAGGSATDSTNVLRFRLGRQNTDTGNIDATGFGEFTMANVRVFTNALDLGTIKAKFDAEKASYGLADTDGDGMPNWYESRCGLNPNSNDAASDLDGDGLSNLREFQLGLRADLADTDGDGANDNAELTRVDPQTSAFATWTNPLLADSDNDGLLDGVETDTGIFVGVNNTGSDPLKADSDGDGYSDGAEVAQGTNPNNALDFPDPSPKINLVTTNLPVGALANWTNIGNIGGVFTANAGGGVVQTNQGVKSVTFSAQGDYTSFNVSNNMVGNPTYSIDAWVYNPGPAVDEETIFAWGRRGGPDGSNASFNHGTAGQYGSMGHWGAGPDLGWGTGVPIQGRWTYVAYSYNGSTLQQTAYIDGAQVNQETLALPLVIWATDNLNNPLPFRIASQQDANGQASTAFKGSLAIGELRVFARVLTPAEITSAFNGGALKYGILDQDNDGIPSWFERQYPGCLNENVQADGGNDCDGDGLNNVLEFNQITSPINPDTDGDGMTDGAEFFAGLNPTNPDTDLDGLNDNLELNILTTNPGDPNGDLDFDGYADWLEVLYGSNPNDFSSTPNTNTPVPLINLDATGLPLGQRASWSNNTGMRWMFTASDTNLAVSMVDGSKAITFAGNNYYTGPGMPRYLGGNAARTVEAWIWNPAVAGEETVFAWARRGNLNQNSAFSHGTDPAFGALQFWAAGDVPWGTNAATITSNLAVGKWTFVAYTYDPTTTNKAVYKDGVLANSAINAAPLDSFIFDPSDPRNTNSLGRSLVFRVGCQNDQAGGPSVPFATMSMAKIRAYNVALSATDIANHYNAEKVQFPGQPVITNVRANGSGQILFDWVPAAGRTYSVETNSNLANSGGWGTAASGLNSGTYTNTTGSSEQFYRMRLE